MTKSMLILSHPDLTMDDMTDTTLQRLPVTLSETVTTASLSNDAWISEGARHALSSTGVTNAQHRLVSIDAPDYPSRLRSIEFPPPYLHVIGEFLKSERAPLAVVGSRIASSEGITATYDVAAALARLGHSIVSGLATGIDAAAHRGALAAQGHTIAVVGTGVDRVYPAEHHELRAEIARRGTIVSQFALGHGPSKTTFPARNAVIAGLSAASLLIESSERSGTRIEAALTLEQAKPVLLWAPILAGASWAQEFAKHPLVRFVESSSEVAAIIDCSP